MTHKEQIQKLQVKLDNSSNFLERLQLGEEIHKLKMEAEGVKPAGANPDVECFGCGS